jgi:hypothetical protein
MDAGVERPRPDNELHRVTAEHAGHGFVRHSLSVSIAKAAKADIRKSIWEHSRMAVHGRLATDGEGLARRAGYGTIPVPLIIYALKGRLTRAQRRTDDAIRRLSGLAAH